VEPTPQRTPLIMQAGASARGSQFAARHAEFIFTGRQTAAQLKKDIGQMTAALEAAGRSREDVRFANVLLPVVARTDKEAQDLVDSYRPYFDPEAALCVLSAFMGTDLSRFPRDEPLKAIESNAVQSIARIVGPDAERPWTVQDLADWFAFGSMGPRFVGSASRVADQMLEWIEESGSDGFNLGIAEFPRSLDAIVDLLVPELQRRGAFKKEYRPGTLREKLFGADPHLPAKHAGASFRKLSPPVEVPAAVRETEPIKSSSN
jgi:alkanesulfonate monooxygenase SsuD/methylene tetrahydromethanopterin reductase-like flavin-dependent oxidoreductase (luciferase family)